MYYPTPLTHVSFYEAIPPSIHLSRQWQHYSNLQRTMLFPFEGHLMLDPQNHRLQDNDIVDLLHR